MEGSAPLNEDDIKLLQSLATRAAGAILTAQVMRAQKMTASELESTTANRTAELSAANQFLDCFWRVAPTTTGSELDGVRSQVSIGDRRPDLLLMDIQLPGMDGLSLTR